MSRLFGWDLPPGVSMRDIDPPDPYQVLSKTGRKARKQHVCSICKKPIEIGQRYERLAALYGEQFEFTKYHIPCQYGPFDEPGDDL